MSSVAGSLRCMGRHPSRKTARAARHGARAIVFSLTIAMVMCSRRAGRLQPFSGAAVLALLLASCGGDARSLVQLEVTGDRPYPHVSFFFNDTATTKKTFADVSFDQSIPVSIGVYLPA